MSIWRNPLKIVSTLRTHKKKTLFFVASVSIVSYLHNRRRKTNQLFRSFCIEAEKYGAQPTSPIGHSRRVLVMLNPEAKGGKCRTNFEKYAAPLLHLAGLEVELARPASGDEMLQVAQAVDARDADVVYVVGGDGTVATVVNGFMHKVDNPNSSQNAHKRSLPPMAVFPGGYDNFFARQFLNIVNPKGVQHYCDSAMAIIKGVIGKRGVIKVELDESEPFYAVQSIQYGDFPEVEQSKYKYWYWGALKRYFAYFRYIVLHKPHEGQELKLLHTNPCHGCSKCVTNDQKKPATRWWHGLIGQPKAVLSTGNDEIDFSKLSNDACGEMHETVMSSTEFLITNDKRSNFQDMRVIFGPSHVSRWAFFKEALARGRNLQVFWPTKDFVSQDFGASSLQVNLTNADGSKKNLLVDGEHREFVDRMKLKFVPRALNYFYLPS